MRMKSGTHKPMPWENAFRAIGVPPVSKVIWRSTLHPVVPVGTSRNEQESLLSHCVPGVALPRCATIYPEAQAGRQRDSVSRRNGHPVACT